MVVLLLGYEGVDDAISEALIFKIPHFQSPEIASLPPLRLPLADVEIRRVVSAIVVLGQAIQQVRIAFQFRQQSCDPSGGLQFRSPKCSQVSDGVFMDEEIQYIDLDIIMRICLRL